MLSFITPSIRVEKLQRLYDSIKAAWSGEFEIIVIGPYRPPEELLEKEEVRFFKDFCSLTTACQKGLLYATGEYITRATDDAIYLPKTLDKAFKLVEDNTVVSLILTEGENWNPSTLDPASYRAGFHEDLRMLNVPADTLLLNYFILDRKTLTDIGGWDCSFEQLSMADVDLAIRLKRYGVKDKITDFQVVKLEWMEGTSGDHAPVHNAHFEHDLPLFKKIYNDAESQQRCFIPLYNWIHQPKKWARRFGG